MIQRWQLAAPDEQWRGKIALASCGAMNGLKLIPILVTSLATLSVVGGFMALDRTFLHWYAADEAKIQTASPSAEMTPTLTEDQASRLAQQHASSLRFPENARYVRCMEATYRDASGTWLVTCEYYYATDSPRPLGTGLYLIDDETGRLVSE